MELNIVYNCRHPFIQIEKWLKTVEVAIKAKQIKLLLLQLLNTAPFSDWGIWRGSRDVWRHCLAHPIVLVTPPAWELPASARATIVSACQFGKIKHPTSSTIGFGSEVSSKNGGHLAEVKKKSKMEYLGSWRELDCWIGIWFVNDWMSTWRFNLMVKWISCQKWDLTRWWGTYSYSATFDSGR